MGWNGSDSNMKPKTSIDEVKRGGFSSRKILTGLGLVLFAGAIYYAYIMLDVSALLHTISSEKTDSDVVETILEDKPISVDKNDNTVGDKTSENREAGLPNITDRAQMIWRGQRAVSWEVSTNKFKIVERIVTADGKKHKMMSDPKGISDFGSDQIIAMAVADDRGNAAPMPSMSAEELDRQFKESLKTPIVINDDDSPQLKEIKERVIIAREALKDIVDEGGSVADALAEHVKTVRAGYETRRECVKAYREFLDSGDEESAKLYLEKANKFLTEKGFDSIPESGRLRER